MFILEALIDEFILLCFSSENFDIFALQQKVWFMLDFPHILSYKLIAIYKQSNPANEMDILSFLLIILYSQWCQVKIKISEFKSTFSIIAKWRTDKCRTDKWRTLWIFKVHNRNTRKSNKNDRLLTRTSPYKFAFVL